MQILGIAGSMRKNSPTNTLVHHVANDQKALEPDAKAEIIHRVNRRFGNKNVKIH